MSLKLQYLQYLQHRADKFLYRGRISSDIKKFFDDKTFYYKQLPCKVNASRDEIVKAWAEINDSFETLINHPAREHTMRSLASHLESR